MARDRPGPSKSAKVVLQAAEVERKVMPLRLSGRSYREISQMTGIPQKTCHNAVMRALKRDREQVAEEAKQIREMELARLDKMLQGIWANASGGNVQAIDRVLRIQERRSKYLGLDDLREYEEDRTAIIDYLNMQRGR